MNRAFGREQIKRRFVWLPISVDAEIQGVSDRQERPIGQVIELAWRIARDRLMAAPAPHLAAKLRGAVQP